MAEISKTAKASMVREVKEVRVETPEESIRQLRLNLVAGLYVTPDRIRVLLSAYDQAREQLLESSWTSTLESGKSYQVTRVHDEISVEELEAREEMKNFLLIFKELIKNPEFLRGIKAAGYKIDFAQLISDFAAASGWKGSPIIEQMIEPIPHGAGAGAPSGNGGFKPGIPPADFDASHIQMKDPVFNHPEEDPHHLVDFGHHTVHKEAAGA